MAKVQIILPAMGEGIIEAEITRWLVKEGQAVEADEPVVEIATDKVDSEIPAPVSAIALLEFRRSVAASWIFFLSINFNILELI